MRIANARIEVPPAEVEIWNGSLRVRFEFHNVPDAQAFLSAALTSESVMAVNLFIKGKFAGARDGRAS